LEERLPKIGGRKLAKKKREEIEKKGEIDGYSYNHINISMIRSKQH
jgi:hypothetical protein